MPRAGDGCGRSSGLTCFVSQGTRVPSLWNPGATPARRAPYPSLWILWGPAGDLAVVTSSATRGHWGYGKRLPNLHWLASPASSPSRAAYHSIIRAAGASSLFCGQTPRGNPEGKRPSCSRVQHQPLNRTGPPAPLGGSLGVFIDDFSEFPKICPGSSFPVLLLCWGCPSCRGLALHSSWPPIDF